MPLRRDRVVPQAADTFRALRCASDPQFETALLLAKLGLDETVIAAALLHDTLDDTQVTEEQLRGWFSSEVVSLVLGVSKMSEISQLHRESERGAPPRSAAPRIGLSRAAASTGPRSLSRKVGLNVPTEFSIPPLVLQRSPSSRWTPSGR